MRLETLGFTAVYDYEGGKLDWLAFGLPVEGEGAETPNAGDVARRDVPTCGLRDRLGTVQERVRAAGWDTCIVVADDQTVLGRLRAKALSGDPEATVEDVMQSGPSTFRPSIPLEELLDYLKKGNHPDAVISTSAGTLIGLFTVSDGERALSGAQAVRRSRRRSQRVDLDNVILGYKLSAEEHPAGALVRYAQRAEDAGFHFASISDHFHPWLEKQGESPFAWSVLGGIACTTQKLQVGTGVTCPSVRLHPGIVAQAAATVAGMMPGRFFLGLGSGEYLNEHIFGDPWPSAPERLAMLEEAIEVIRTLWQGGVQRHHGQYYRVEDAQIFSLPDSLPPIYIAGSGPVSARLAGQAGDGLIGIAPSEDLVAAFEDAGGTDKPRYAELTVCWAPTEAEAISTARAWWAMPALGGNLNAELRLPKHFEQAASTIRDEDIAAAIICGPDPEKHIEGIRKFIEAGFDRVWIHQVGPDQEGFFTFSQREILSKIGTKAKAG